MTNSGRNLDRRSNLLVGGRRVSGKVRLLGGGSLVIKSSGLPTSGMYLLQVQNLHGLFSNELMVRVVGDVSAAKELQQSIDATY